MNFKKLTQMVMIGIVLLIVIILIYDAYAISQGGTEASISSQIIVLSYKQPFLVSMISWWLSDFGNQRHLYLFVSMNDAGLHILSPHPQIPKRHSRF